ncbi:MAG: FAD binding domain-containing protein [Gaiellaceae bacterium]
MKPPPFRYERPETVEEAAALLAEHGDEAKVLAGGQSLVPLLNFRLLRPAVLVDVNRVAGLDRIEGGRIGATVRQSDFAGVSLAAQALPSVGHFATRNRGTVGGSIAHADPSAELPLCLLVLGGSVVTTKREIAAGDFFRSHFTTALEPDELVVETVWPEGGAVAFEEFAQRHGDFALSLAACSVRVENGTITEARVGIGAVTDRPSLLQLGLEGAPANGETASEAGARAAAAVDPPGNLHASPAYLRHLTGVLVERVLTKAFA